MLPARWMKLATLPKNVNGKINRKELRDRFAQNATAIAIAGEGGTAAGSMATT
jgi:acyl-coenzyme A synthetase/AMP-(fatty) acid ligase